MSNQRVGIVAVALNERKALEVTSHQVRDIMNKTGLVQYLRDHNFDVVVQSSPGLPAALREGIAWVRARSCDVIVMFQPDGNCDASRLPDLISPLINSNAELVIGSRYFQTSRSEDDSLLTSLGNTLFRLLFKIRFPKSELRDPIVGYRAFRVELLDRLSLLAAEQYQLLEQALRTTLSFDPLMTARALKSGVRVVEVDAPEPSRIGGSPKRQSLRWGFAYGLQVLFDSWVYPKSSG
jgi:Glycosyl transferase family 2